MIKTLEINNFRRFKHLEVNNFKKINLILGNNNSGKTSLLESIFTYCSGENINPIISTVVARGRQDLFGSYDFVEKAAGIFNNKNSLKFNIKGTNFEDKVMSVNHKVNVGDNYLSIVPNTMMSSLVGNINNKILDWEISINNKNSISYALEGDLMHSLNQIATFNPVFPVNFNDILSHRNQKENTIIYGKLKRSNMFNEFRENMKEVFGDIEDIDSIPYPDGSSSPVSLKFKGTDLLPLYNFGDGQQRWFNILGNMMTNPNLVYCIEEIDSTFHYKAQKNLSKNIVKYANMLNSQVFITSHSIEFVDNFLDGISELGENMLSNINIITLKSNDKGDIKVREMDGLKAIKNREEYNLELR